MGETVDMGRSGFSIILDDRDGGVPEVDWDALSVFLGPVADDLANVPARKTLGKAVFDARLFGAAAGGSEQQILLVRIRQIASAADLALELFAGDRSGAVSWMTTRTDFLFDRSPVEVILGGHGETIIKTQLEWIGRVP